MIGGYVDASIKRAAELGDGWIAGGLPPDEFAAMHAMLEEAWSAAGREGEPRSMGLAYYGLGENGAEEARHWLGEETANQIAASAANDADTVRAYLEAYEGAGCGELILFPTSSDPAQVDLLADAAGL